MNCVNHIQFKDSRNPVLLESGFVLRGLFRILRHIQISVMKKNLFGLILFLLVLISACTPSAKEPTAEELITKSWRIEKMSLAGEMVNPALMGSASYTFYNNGRFEILMGELARGKWELSPDKKILITTEDPGNKRGEMDILELTKDKLVLSNGDHVRPMRLDLVPQ